MVKKPDETEQLLEQLGSLRSQGGPEVASELRRALKHRSNLVIAKAAKIAGEIRVQELLPDLVSAFERLMQNPVRLDKRCAATTEIVTALYEMDYLEAVVYLSGIGHVQFEASYGPPVDEAAKLRAQSALGLVRTSHPERLFKVAELLADPQPMGRIGAIRALAACAGDPGTLLLRFKALSGDREPEVMSECFAGLLQSDFARSVPFVQRYMDAEDISLAESAALALGSCRHPQAFAVLRGKWERTVGPLQQTLLAAMAMTRLEESTDFLIGLLDEAAIATASSVITVLATYCNDERVRASVKEVVERRGNAQLKDVFRQEF
jgi:hypothetical protein